MSTLVKTPSTELETEWVSTPVTEQVASAAETNLTAGSITPTFPANSTAVRVILIARIHVSNQSDNTHQIGIKVQGQKASGGYSTLLNLTASPPLSLANLEGSGDGWAAPIDVSSLVDESGEQYDFRFAVDSDDANAVNYTTDFCLVLVYKV